MKPRHCLLLIVASIALESQVAADTETTKPHCTTATSGSIKGVKHPMLVTSLSPEIRNWVITVTRKVPSECDFVNGMEVTVCDAAAPPKVRLNNFLIKVQRKGSLQKTGDIEFSVYCDDLDIGKVDLTK